MLWFLFFVFSLLCPCPSALVSDVSFWVPWLRIRTGELQRWLRRFPKTRTRPWEAFSSFPGPSLIITFPFPFPNKTNQIYVQAFSPIHSPILEFKLSGISAFKWRAGLLVFEKAFEIFKWTSQRCSDWNFGKSGFLLSNGKPRFNLEWPGHQSRMNWNLQKPPVVPWFPSLMSKTFADGSLPTLSSSSFIWPACPHPLCRFTTTNPPPPAPLSPYLCLVSYFLLAWNMFPPLFISYIFKHSGATFNITPLQNFSL